MDNLPLLLSAIRRLSTALASLAGMFLVPKFPPIPRLSIIVPVGHDVSAFEATLISVLENRPQQCEIIVPHDGRYDDPFELGDEVRLVVAEGGNLVDLIMAGARASRGHFLHVLADGLRATEGWTDSALNRFEQHAAAVVAPVVRNANDHRIVSAGWRDSRTQLMQPVAAGKANVSDKDSTAEIGAYLRASFWRRSVFLSLGDAFLYDGGDRNESTSEASYVFQPLLQRSGWQGVLATDCEVVCEQHRMFGEEASLDRGRRLGAVKRHFSGSKSSMTLVGIVKAAIGSIIRTGACGEWFGRATSGRRMTTLQKRIRPEIVQSHVESSVVPIEDSQNSHLVRRAA